MDTNFNFVVNEDDLLKALESGATMEQIKNIFNSAINKAADKQLQKQKEEKEAHIAKKRDKDLREALDYLLDWYEAYYDKDDTYTIPHAVITPTIRDYAVGFVHYIVEEYKRKMKEKNNTVVESCTNSEAEKKKEDSNAADAKKNPEVRVYTHRIRDPKEIDRILGDFFNYYKL